MGKLEDLRVERVDGVDRPATGHRWMIVKSESAEESVEKDHAALAKTALEALSKEEGLSLNGESVAALKALAAALDIELDFAKAEEPETAPEVEAESDVEKDESDAPVTRGELGTLIAEGVEKAMGAIIDRELDDETPAPTMRLAKSKQPKEQDGGNGSERVIAKGEGLYEDVIFNQ